MNAWDQLRGESIENVLKNLQEEIRSQPDQAKLRIYLFQLLCIQGKWDRAINQLDVIKDLDVEALPMVHAYRAVIKAEVFRHSVFSGTHQPLIFGEPPNWIASLIQSLKELVAGNLDKANNLRNYAFDNANSYAGSINDKQFEWIADADSRLGPVLEVIIDGKYYWLPFDNINEITLEAPSHLRDLVWQPANFQWKNGGEWYGFIPSRYSGTISMGDNNELLGRQTRWIQYGNNENYGYQGIGQRMFATDSLDISLFDSRKITFGQ